MATTTLTLALDGEMPLDRFAKAMQHFCELVYGLSAEVAPAARIVWTIDDALAGDTQVTVCGTATDDEAVAAVATAFLNVGRALAAHASMPFGQRAADEAHALAGLLDDPVDSIRFETAADDVLVPSPRRTNGLRPLIGVYGGIQGRVLSVPTCNALRFMVVEHIDHRPVACYLQEDQRHLLRGAWGRRIAVEGWLYRIRDTDRAVSLRHITHLDFVADVPPGSLITRARGILPAAPGDPSPAELIRRLRDAGDD